MNKAEEIYKTEMSYLDRAVSDVESFGHAIHIMGKDILDMMEKLAEAVARASDEMGDAGDDIAQRETASYIREAGRAYKDTKNALNQAITVADNTVQNAGLRGNFNYLR